MRLDVGYSSQLKRLILSSADRMHRHNIYAAITHLCAIPLPDHLTGGEAVLICAAGDIHGAINQFYDDVLAFEVALGATFDWVLHVGDFGVWPDPERIDRATRYHDGAGDFSEWLLAMRRVPRQTIFIKGNHEDFAWLESQMGAEVLPGLVYLRNGCRMDLESASGDKIRVGGVGGCYGPSDYSRASRTLQGYARRHYTHDEVDRLGSSGPLDLLLTHDAPAGVRFQHHRRGGYVSEAAGLDILLGRVRPLVCFFGHHHARVDAQVSGVRCVGLNKIGRPGNLIAVEVDLARRAWSILTEYGALPQHYSGTAQAGAVPPRRDHQRGLPRFAATWSSNTGGAEFPQEVLTYVSTSAI